MGSQVSRSPDADVVPVESQAAATASRPRTVARLLPTRGIHLLGLVAIATVAYPLIAIVVRSSQNLPAAWQAIVDEPTMGRALLYTVLLALGCVIIALVAGVLLALCVANLPRRWYNAAQILCTLPIFLPPVAAVVGWIFVFAPTIGYGNVLIRKLFGMETNRGPFNIYSLTWIILITAMYLISYVFLFVSTALRESDATLELSARVFGAGWLGSQLRVVLPSIRPALYYSVGICLLLGLGQFAAPLLLGVTAKVDVITTVMYTFMAGSPPNVDSAALLALPLLVAAVVVVAVQRRSLGSMRRYQSISRGASRARLPRRAFVIFPALYVTLAIVPPLVALVLVSLSPYWRGEINFSTMTFDSYTQVFDNRAFVDSIVTTLQVTLIGMVVALVLSVLVGLYLTRSRSRVARVLDFVLNLPVATPGIVIGLAILISYGLGFLSLYGTTTIFVIAYVYLYLIFGLRMVVSGLSRIPDSLENAARVSGASAFGALVRIVLPLLRGSLASSALLMLVLMSHEFAASSALKTGPIQVLSTKLYDAYTTGIYPQVAALALIMVAISAVCAAVVLGMRGGRNLEL
ncbi:iron ABC transporter permease [Dactylosporangium fulvum]|uniref:ABC transporter permease subunit n=1 Tax=Dactylosporangium fulvum TaxID=53359 RepID=A0ABY5VTF2_9ACTN|nr:ABC transporter permease subunit [Dactylosporangium fulvum]UWP80099.1 ABC transporter permease subunit [Dactylosporangium fulvum]